MLWDLQHLPHLNFPNGRYLPNVSVLSLLSVGAPCWLFSNTYQLWGGPSHRIWLPSTRRNSMTWQRTLLVQRRCALFGPSRVPMVQSPLRLNTSRLRMTFSRWILWPSPCENARPSTPPLASCVWQQGGNFAPRAILLVWARPNGLRCFNPHLSPPGC